MRFKILFLEWKCYGKILATTEVIQKFIGIGSFYAPSPSHSELG